MEHNGSMDNPTPNCNGLIGEVDTLPYIVPRGYILHLETWGVESYNHAGTIILVPWIGDGPVTNEKCLPSAGARGGTKQLSGNFQIPAGKIVNMRLLNSQHSGVYAWFASGRLMTI